MKSKKFRKREYAYGWLNVFGRQAVCDTLASGCLPAELAAQYALSPLDVEDWIVENFTPDELVRIRDASVASLDAKCKLTLDAIEMYCNEKSNADHDRIETQQYIAEVYRVSSQIMAGKWA